MIPPHEDHIAAAIQKQVELEQREDLKRRRDAAAALQGLIASNPNITVGSAARCAFTVADAMLAESDKKP